MTVALQTSQFTFAAVAVLVFYVGFLGLLAAWVHRDAAAHGEHTTLWVAVSVLVPFGVVVYLYKRRGWHRERPRTRRDHRVETVLLATAGGFLAGALFAPSDPVTQALWMLAVTLAALPLAYLLVYRDGWGRLREAL